MKILFLWLFVLLVSVEGYGQRRHKKERINRSRYEMRDTFKFNVIHNDFNREPNLSIQLNPYYFELYGLNVNMGYDAGIQVNYRKFNLWGSYRGAYLELVNKNTVDERNSLGGPATSPLNFIQGEAGLEYILKSDEDENEESIGIGNFGGYNYSRTINAKFQEQFILRLGAQYLQTYVSGDQISFGGYYVNDASRKNYNFGPGQMGTNLQENIISAGVAEAYTHDIFLKNPTLGVSGRHFRTVIYGDLLVSPAMVYTNVIMKNYSDISRQPYTDFNINDGTPKSRIGFRAGFRYESLSPVGLTFTLEAGDRPGPTFVTGFYGMIKFGVAFNAKMYSKRQIDDPNF